MTLRVAILHQGFIPPYRVRFYELLNQRGGAEYVVFHGAPPSETGSRAAVGPFRFPNRWVRNREIRIGRWAAIYQPVLREVLSGGFDAIVLGHEIKFISSLLLAPLAKARGVAVLYWGFGYHVRVGLGLIGEATGWVGAPAAFIKNVLAHLADGYLAYTAGGARKLAATGYAADRIFVLGNTIDIADQIRLHGEMRGVDPAAVRRELGLRPESTVFVYIGRLIPAKQVEILIEAVRRINDERRAAQPVEALIVGTGPLGGALKAAAKGAPSVRFLDAVPDRELARILRVAAAVVIPGIVGLAANHAFAQGQPVITLDHALHSPEVEYIVPGVNGLIVEGGIDELADALARFADAPDQQARLAEGALRTRDTLGLETMVEQFDRAVRAISARKRPNRAAPSAAENPTGK